MDSDSGLPSSPTRAEDSFTHVLQQEKNLHDPTQSHLNRALLEPGSTSAQLEAVEELARQVEEMLARRLDRRQHRDEEDGFEFTAELDGYPKSSSMSPAPETSELRQQPVIDSKTYPDGTIKQKTVLKSTKSLDAYQRYPTAGMRRSSVGANAADKYRLSFVDISDSSDEESKLVPVCTIDPICHSESTTSSRGDVENDLESENELQLDKTGQQCREMVNRPNVPRKRHAHLLRPLELKSIETFADLQYDDDEITPAHHTLYTNPNNVPDGHTIKEQAAVFHHCHSSNGTHHKTITSNENNGLMSEDEDTKLLTSSANSRTDSKPCSKSYKHTKAKNLEKRSIGVHSRSAVVKTNENTTHHNAPMKQSAVCMDHASFSPLYKMTVSQLQYVVQLLETKLQASSGTLIRLLHEKESLIAENCLLHENIARISRRLQQLYEAQQ